MRVATTSQDEFLAISDVANLQVTQKTVYGLVQKGDLPGFKVGGQWRFRRTAIDSWIKVKTHAGVQLAYEEIVVALAVTRRLIAEIDGVIEQHGGWPDAVLLTKIDGRVLNS